MLAINQKKNGTLALINRDGKTVARCETLHDARTLSFSDDYVEALVAIGSIKPEDGNEPDFEALFHEARAIALQAILRPGK
ncbi:MAG: hypothetical protein V3S98_06145 [Dehalococcoidia bacterium]